jgi:hypothetical protein
MTQEDLGFMIGNLGKQIGRIERRENNVTSFYALFYIRSIKSST